LFLSISDVEKNALNVFWSLPQVTKNTGLSFVPLLPEMLADDGSIFLQREFSRWTLFTPAMIIFSYRLN